MRFTPASVAFVLVSAMVAMFSAEAAAITRRAEPVQADVLLARAPVPEPEPALRVHVRDFSAVPRAVPAVIVEERAVNTESLNRRSHSRDFRFAARAVEARSDASEETGNLNRRIHSRDFRSVH
ncbi:hypothetical protein BDP27DRAFT_1320204 [Rhodocollybia butyracea]|uniref:Uncharacterized protein n=1 Tax=Rhodocollybia butyracea TaxID=206335 RepID=A0A9P5Q042_9AGAR|nr:hypothetical protein BDP27DRAFT_1320204 [Rhodocollybia butyracea]